MASALLNSGSLWFKLAAVSGCTAVGMGAYGSHGFKPQDPYYLEVFRRANHYHLLHSLLLAIAPSTRRPWLVGGLTLVGMTLFSGSCYTVALQQERTWAKLAPFGGMTLMAAWLALAF
ncbi:hypothetical protein HYH02_010804 [Chlamydomonas schloesseri]|uniref:Transmembrane protein 256 homolog n=1 Tax=Chlamydomonas schloesseri TaxID=2026947 RepID=A0A835T8K0_9CHLO|nr:hypothetical protein HYH02_010804 [Chlamydomonas schloesseri]|eukprot:KAG2438348.1 hypothetical protein HYH02_010804 [Chlamydomonas schloesseri]